MSYETYEGLFFIIIITIVFISALLVGGIAHLIYVSFTEKHNHIKKEKAVRMGDLLYAWRRHERTEY